MDDLENAVAGVLISDDAKGLVTTYAEIGVDALLEDGVAHDIPVISSLVAVAKMGVNVRDRQFTKKLLKFLKPFAEIDAGERQKLVGKLEEDPKYGRKVADHLIEILDRIELLKKPKMVAAVFLAYMKGEIDVMMLHRLIRSIELVPLHELADLRRFCEADESKRDAPIVTRQSLLAAGLLNAVSGYGGLVYQPNEISAAFLELELDRLE